MTSMPASRSARAMTFAPRSCPSRPGLAMRTRIGRAMFAKSIKSFAEPSGRQLLRVRFPGSAAVRNLILLFAGHLGKRPRPSLGHEDRIPAEASPPSRSGRDGATRGAAGGDELGSVEIGDGARRRRASVVEGVEHAGYRRDTGALLEPLDERSRKPAPRVEGQS